jgi:cysteine desulfurase
MIYLDYAASCPVDKEILDTYYEANLKYYANPNSFHKLGLQAKDKIDQASMNILKNLNLEDYEIIYTSGASESNNLVVKGIAERYKNRGKHIILGCLEHNSTISAATSLPGYEIDVVSIDKNGLIDIDELKELLRDDTILVSIASVDSELGMRQPIEEIGELLKNYPNCYFHTDASQAIGKCVIDFHNADLITITPHKFYGLNGTGALIKRKNIGLKPLIDGGRSTTVYRSGTPVVSDIIALDKAVDLAIRNQQERINHITELNHMIINQLKTYKNIHLNSNENSVVNIINFSIKNTKSSQIIDCLEENDIYVSAKTSCCPKNTPSKLVYALTHDKALSLSSIRLSLSHLTTKDEIKEFLKIFDGVIENGKI